MSRTGDLNAAIEKQAGEVAPMSLEENQQATLGTFKTLAEQAERQESEPAALVPEGAPARGMPEPGDVPSPSELAALEKYITAGVAKAMASLGGAEIVTVSAFKAAVEALLRHLHADHPENYL